MNSFKFVTLAGFSLMISHYANAIVVGPMPINPAASLANCVITQQNTTGLSPAVIDAKTQLQGQLCRLQNQAKMQQLAIQNQIQNLVNTQVQIKALQQKMAMTTYSNQSHFKWVPGKAHIIPAHAFIAGENNGQKIYICQAQYSGNPPGYAASNLYPGQLAPEGCVITYAGQTFVIDPYNILTSTEAGYWATPEQAGDEPMRSNPVYMDTNTSPLSQVIVSFQQKSAPEKPVSQAIIGGYEYDHYLYVCRVKLNDIYQVGKVVSGNCNVAWQNKEGSWPDYQVLMTDQPRISTSSSS